MMRFGDTSKLSGLPACGAITAPALVQPFGEPKPNTAYDHQVPHLSGAPELAFQHHQLAHAVGVAPLLHPQKVANPARCLTPQAIDFVEPEPKPVDRPPIPIPSFHAFIIDSMNRPCPLLIPTEYMEWKRSQMIPPKEARKRNLVELKCGHCDSVKNEWFPSFFALALEHRLRHYGFHFQVMAVGDESTREKTDPSCSGKRHDFMLTVWINLNRVTGRRAFFEFLMSRNHVSDLVIGSAGQPVRFMMPRSDAARFFDHDHFDPTSIHPALLECVLEAAPKERCRSIALRAMFDCGMLTTEWYDMLIRMHYEAEEVDYYYYRCNPAGYPAYESTY